MNRVMDIAVIRDGKIEHAGESVLLACLLKVKGSSNRPRQQVEEIGKVMRDPNLDE